MGTTSFGVVLVTTLEAWSPRHVVQEHKFLPLGRGFWLESHLRSWTKSDLSVSHYLHFSKSPSAQLIPGKNSLPLHLLVYQISADALTANTMLRHEICRACFDFSLSLAKQVWRTGLSRLCFAATNLATGFGCLLECSLSMSQLWIFCLFHLLAITDHNLKQITY